MLHPFLVLALAIPPLAGGSPALRGFDPVELCKSKKEVAGDPARAVERDGFLYLFASDASLAAFKADPERYEIQMGGACARMGPLSGCADPDRYAVYEHQLYIFASDACRKAFVEWPERYVDVVETALGADDDQQKRGRELVELALRGFGGAEKVDAVRILRTEKRAAREEGGKSYATREVNVWRMPDGLRRESAWDDRVYTTVVTPQTAFQGSGEMKPLTRAGAAEFRRVMGREPLWLLRRRGEPGYEVACPAKARIGGADAEILRIHFEGIVTDLTVETATGRVLRAAWIGRIDSGIRGDVVVDFSDFRDVGGVVLPHARKLQFDREVVEHLSGKIDAVEIDPAIPPSAFQRGT